MGKIPPLHSASSIAMFSIYTDMGKNAESRAQPICTDLGDEEVERGRDNIIFFIPRFNSGWNKNLMTFTFSQRKKLEMHETVLFTSCIYVIV